MDNIAMLCDTISKLVSGANSPARSGDRLSLGQVSNGLVTVDGAVYSADWAADVDPIDGISVYCVVTGGRCVVLGHG